MLFHDIVGRTLRREEQDAEKVLVRARPSCHGRRILCGCRLRRDLKNGGDALPMERQADAKLVTSPDIPKIGSCLFHQNVSTSLLSPGCCQCHTPP